MLNSLQNHVEREENRWSEQVQVLQAELSALTEERNSLLHKMKVSALVAKPKLIHSLGKYEVLTTILCSPQL